MSCNSTYLDHFPRCPCCKVVLGFFWSCRRFLEQAVQTTDSLERLIQATAFTCASYYGSIHRDAKPFNPLLGETFEFQDSRSWFLAEQVRWCVEFLA